MPAYRRGMPSPEALVAVRGNRYSVPPGLTGTMVVLGQRLGSERLEVRVGERLLATHRLAHDGAGIVVRDQAHSDALEKVVLAQFTTKRPCDKKAYVGVSEAALQERARLLGVDGRDVSVNLDDYARLAAS